MDPEENATAEAEDAVPEPAPTEEAQEAPPADDIPEPIVLEETAVQAAPAADVVEEVSDVGQPLQPEATAAGLDTLDVDAPVDTTEVDVPAPMEPELAPEATATAPMADEEVQPPAPVVDSWMEMGGEEEEGDYQEEGEVVNLIEETEEYMDEMEVVDFVDMLEDENEFVDLEDTTADLLLQSDGIEFVSAGDAPVLHERSYGTVGTGSMIPQHSKLDPYPDIQATSEHHVSSILMQDGGAPPAPAPKEDVEPTAEAKEAEAAACEAAEAAALAAATAEAECVQALSTWPVRSTDPYDSEPPAHRPPMLPADHPLLAKFQRSLREHLLKVNAALQNDIDELDDGIVKLERQTRDAGAKLHDAQSALDRQHHSFDDFNEQFEDLSGKRLAHEANTAKTQRKVNQEERNFRQLQRDHAQHQHDLQQIQQLENNLIRWHREIDDKVQLAKRVVNKDGQEQQLRAQEKCQMDMLLYNLEAQVKRDERQLAATQEQLKEQQGVVEVLQQSITDANADVQALAGEHKNLITAWNDVIFCIKGRDAKLEKLRKEVFEEKQEQKVTDLAIVGTRKVADKEMETSEKLEAFRQKIVTDIEEMELQIEKDTKAHDKVVAQMEQMEKVITDTEANQARAKAEGMVIENQLKQLRRVIDRHNEKKIEIEGEIMLLLQDQLTSDQSSKHRAKGLKEAQAKRRYMELNVFNTEQQLSAALLEVEEVKGAVEFRKVALEEYKNRKHEEAKKSESKRLEISVIVKSIGLKARRFDNIFQKLQDHIKSMGGVETDPNEAKAAELEKKNSELDNKMHSVNSFWLLMQGHVVGLTERYGDQTQSIQLAEKQLIVIARKYDQIESELATLHKQGNETRRNLSSLYHKLSTVNARLFADRQQHETAESECGSMHQELVGRLREAEMQILRIADETRQRRSDIEEANAAAVERHREALAWETKWKMACETLRYRNDQHAAQSECGQMRAEIHRMEVRLNQLGRAQQKLAIDMELCVTHRDTIHDGARVREKLPSKGKGAARHTVQHRLNDLRNRQKQAQSQLSVVERETAEAADAEQRISLEVRVLQRMEVEEREQDRLLLEEIEQRQLQRQENLEKIVRVQQRARKYRSLLGDKKQRRANETNLQAELERQHERREHLQEVLESLLQQYPEQQWQIRRAMLALKVD